MYDAALLMRVPQMTQAAAELGRALARVGGHMEWTAVPAAVASVLTDRDLIAIASCGLLPPDVSYLVLLIYAPDEREDEVCEVWDIFVDSYGIAQQPTQAMEDLVDQWQLAHTGQEFTTNPCHEIDNSGLPQDHTTNFLRRDNVTVTYQHVEAVADSSRREDRDQLAENILAVAGQTPDEILNQLFGSMRAYMDRSSTERPHDEMSPASAAAWQRSVTNNLSRQQEAFYRRCAAEEASRFHIDWYATSTWSAPAPEQADEETWTYQIDQMEDQHLWGTIIWLVRSCQQLYVQYVQHRGSGLLALESKTWLRTQPAFRALLHEAIERELTFPKDVYKYLREYVLAHGDDSVQLSSPWKDPGESYQAGQLEEFLGESIVPEESIEEACGKNLRDIKID